MSRFYSAAELHRAGLAEEAPRPLPNGGDTDRPDVDDARGFWRAVLAALRGESRPVSSSLETVVHMETNGSLT